MLSSEPEYHRYPASVEGGCHLKNGSKCSRPSFYMWKLAAIFVPMLMMAITALTVGIIYPAEPCDRNEILSLSWWLRSYGGVSIYFAITYPILLLMIPTTRCELLAMEILLMGFSFATIAWNVFGCTILFRGSLSCYSESSVLWYTTLIALIAQWYNFFVSCMAKLVREHSGSV
jgi:hypothetical protein